ncbi:MAG: CocE/NonD family hydrolase [Gemmatimonadetes bacterium]|nr:CocE/NonD family hydrolase [Gemmatimonadota bacterium]
MRIALAGLGLLTAIPSGVGLAQRADILDRLGVADVAQVERMIMVPMRDGVRLSTAVIRPKSGDRLATILIRTPYLKEQELLGYRSLYAAAVRRGYAIVVQNERGTEWSEGQHRFLAGARTDGYDALTWIAAQPWSNGRVGTIGCSSSAEHQLALAAMNHPAHRAMIPMSAGAGIGAIPGVSTQGLFYKGGIPQLGPWAGWYVDFGHVNRPKLPPTLTQDERIRLADFYLPYPKPEAERFGLPSVSSGIRGAADAGGLAHLPSGSVLRSAGVPESDFDTFMTMAPTDPRWLAIDFIRDGDRPRVPALHVNGWHDVGAFETIKLYEYLRDQPNQYLIMAPTAHCAMTRATADYRTGERPVGNAAQPYDELFLAWFDHWLRDGPATVLDRPRVQAFLEGGNRWLSLPTLPVPTARSTRFYLSSTGRAQSLRGDGRLLTEQPVGGTPDSIRSDPMQPVPSRGGGCCDRDAVRDQRPVEARPDVLVYSTPPLTRGIAVMGEITGTIYLSTSARDTDVHVKLVDVYPDGRAFNLYDAAVRLRYRTGFDTPTLATPGEVYPVEITGLVAGNYFGPGHRIRIEIAGSNFPGFERNLQTGGRNHDETRAVVAINRVHPGSFFDFPVIDGIQSGDKR